MSENLKKGSSEFKLTGKVKIGEYTFEADKTSATGWKYTRLNLGVDCGGKFGIIYSEAMGGFSTKGGTKVYCHGLKENENGNMVDDYKNRMEIAWEDRTKQAIVEKAGYDCFFSAGLELDVNNKPVIERFLAEYDFIKYVEKHLKDGMVVNVVGGFEFGHYEGKTTMKKKIKGVYLNTYDEPNLSATFKQSLLFDKDVVSYQKNDEGGIDIQGYVIDYVGKHAGQPVKKNFTFPFGLSVALKDLANSEKFVAKFLKPAKAKLVTEVTLTGEILRGASEVDITIDDLTEEVRDLIELGCITEEEALKKAVGGNKSKETFVAKSVDYYKSKDGNVVFKHNNERYSLEDLEFFESYLAETSETVVETKTTTTKETTKKETTKEDEDFNFDDFLDDEDLPF